MTHSPPQPQCTTCQPIKGRSLHNKRREGHRGACVGNRGVIHTTRQAVASRGGFDRVSCRCAFCQAWHAGCLSARQAKQVRSRGAGQAAGNWTGGWMGGQATGRAAGRTVGRSDARRSDGPAGQAHRYDPMTPAHNRTAERPADGLSDNHTRLHTVALTCACVADMTKTIAKTTTVTTKKTEMTITTLMATTSMTTMTMQARSRPATAPGRRLAGSAREAGRTRTSAERPSSPARLWTKSLHHCEGHRRTRACHKSMHRGPKVRRRTEIEQRQTLRTYTLWTHTSTLTVPSAAQSHCPSVSGPSLSMSALLVVVIAKSRPTTASDYCPGRSRKSATPQG